MNNLTFLMPCRIESEDRLKNVITSVSYITNHFPQCQIIVKENDAQSVFVDKALPIIQKIFGTTPPNLQHIFEQSENKFFYKTRILNDLLLESKTEIVYNYDVDVVYPVSSYTTAYNMIAKGGFDAVYPYGCGVYQWAVDYPIPLFDAFIQSKFDLDILQPNCKLQPSVMGWGQMIKRQVYIDSYMWNENFISWGAEDCEYYYRLQALGYRVGRVNDMVYHFDHARTFNSHYHNPKFMDNHNLWQTIRNLNKDAIMRYYEDQNYVKERRDQLNASV
jgi:hypothetical protein